MTKDKIKEKLSEYVLLECEVEDICNFLSDMFDELAKETEAKEPYAANTIQKYRIAAAEIIDMGILLTDVLENTNEQEKTI